MAIVKAKNLSFSYDWEEGPLVLDGVSFELEEGKHTCLIGHNGSGKSSLAKIIDGLLLDYKGELEVFGMRVIKENVRQIRKMIGLVFQNPDNQFVGASVRDDIAFGLENRLIEREKMDSIIASVLETVDMLPYIDKAPENLSGGEKQRVALAGAIALSPSLLILDESTSMLDPKGKREVLETLKKLKDEKGGLTILSITHDVEEAFSSDRVIVLNDGKIVLDGTPHEVFAHADILRQARISLPFHLSLMNELREKGVKIPNTVQTEDELLEFLCQ